MANLNKVMLMGNLTRDPEVRYTPKGTAVAELGLAINRVYTADNNEKREETTFVDVTLWGRTAEIAGEYLKKGRPVFIEGRLQLDTWDDKQTGQKRSKLKVVGEAMQLMGARDRGRLRRQNRNRRRTRTLHRRKTIFRFRGVSRLPTRFIPEFEGGSRENCFE